MADENITRKLMREFTLQTDITSPTGMQFASSAENYLKSALKALNDDMRVLTKTIVDNGKRMTTFAFSGNQQTVESFKAMVKSLPDQLNLQGRHPFSGVGDPQVANRYYTEMTSVIEDAKTKARAAASAASSGGKFYYDPVTSTGTVLVRSRGALTPIQEQIASGNMAARQRFEAAAFRQQIKDPTSEAFYRNEANKLTAADARQAAKERYIKENPDSPLALREKARSEKLAKVEQDKEQAAATRNERMGGNIMGAALRTVVGLLITIGATLVKILGGVLETAENTMQLAFGATRYNMDTQTMQNRQFLATRLGIQNEDVFAGAYGVLMSKFANPNTASFGPSINGLAPLLQEDTPMLTGFVDGGLRNPDELLNSIMASVFRASLSGRGGVMEGLTPEAAFSRNIALIQEQLGANVAEIMTAVWYNMQQTGDRNFSTVQSGDTLAQYLEGVRTGAANASGPTIITPDAALIAAAEEHTKAINAFKSFWDSLKTTVFDRLLSAVEDITVKLQELLLPLVMQIDPVAAAQQFETIDAQNRRDYARVNSYIQASYASPEFGVTSWLDRAMQRGRDIGSTADFERQVAAVAADPNERNIQRLFGDDATLQTWAEFLTGTGVYAQNLLARDKLLSARHQTASGLFGRIENVTLPTANVGDAAILDAQNRMNQSITQRIGMASSSNVFGQFVSLDWSVMLRDLLGLPKNVLPRAASVDGAISMLREEGVTLEDLQAHRMQMIRSVDPNWQETTQGPFGEIPVPMPIPMQLRKNTWNADEVYIIDDLIKAFVGTEATGGLTMQSVREMARQIESQRPATGDISFMQRAAREGLAPAYREWLTKNPDMMGNLLSDDLVRFTPGEGGTIHIQLDVMQDGKLIDTIRATANMGQSGVNLSTNRQVGGAFLDVFVESSNPVR